EESPANAPGRANVFMTISFHGGVLLGPPVGGFVIDVVSWRWIFFLLVPIGVAGIVLTVLRARGHRPARGEGRPPIDYARAPLPRAGGPRRGGGGGPPAHRLRRRPAPRRAAGRPDAAPRPAERPGHR